MKYKNEKKIVEAFQHSREIADDYANFPLPDFMLKALIERVVFY